MRKEKGKKKERGGGKTKGGQLSKVMEVFLRCSNKSCHNFNLRFIMSNNTKQCENK